MDYTVQTIISHDPKFIAAYGVVLYVSGINITQPYHMNSHFTDILFRYCWYNISILTVC